MTDQALNEAVASKLGWVWQGRWAGGVKMWLRKFDNFHDNWNQARYLPDYSGDIQVAWEIVQKQDCVSLLKLKDARQWVCCFDDYDMTNLADTAPEAICKAFLKLSD